MFPMFLFYFVFLLYIQHFHCIFHYISPMCIYAILVNWQTNSLTLATVRKLLRRTRLIIFYKLAPFVTFLSTVQQNVRRKYFEMNGRQTIVNTTIVEFLFLKSDCRWQILRFKGKLVIVRWCTRVSACHRKTQMVFHRRTRWNVLSVGVILLSKRAIKRRYRASRKRSMRPTDARARFWLSAIFDRSPSWFWLRHIFEARRVVYEPPAAVLAYSCLFFLLSFFSSFLFVAGVQRFVERIVVSRRAVPD